MIVLEDVYKRYKTDHGFGKWVFEGLSITIPTNVSVGVVGKNGAGKSTLLKLISGADHPTRGTIQRDCRVSWLMGFSGGLQGALTGRQNARFICRIHGYEHELDERLAMIQEFAGLGDEFDEPTSTYSSGMQARLKFALSLAFDFDVYVSDELTAVGDAAFKEKTLQAFKNRVGQAGLIMVAHQENVLKEFCSAGIWVNDGHAYWFDDLDEALSAYRESVGIKAPVNTVSGTPAVKTLKQPRQSVEKNIQNIEKNKKNIKQDRRNNGGNAQNSLGIATIAGQPGTDEAAIAQKLQEDCRLMLELGRQGAPRTVDFEEGRQLINCAKKQGVELVRKEKIGNKGYRLKANVSPILRRRLKDTPEQMIEFYDLNSQCEKIGPGVAQDD